MSEGINKGGQFSLADSGQYSIAIDSIDGGTGSDIIHPGSWEW